MFNRIFGKGNNVQTIIGNCTNSTVTINDVSYQGKSVSVIGNKVIIDGVDVTPDSKTVNIHIDGNVERLESQTCNTMVINGNVSDLTSNTGDVQVTGNVAGNVKNNVGDVKVGGTVHGGVKTNVGDIKYKK